MGLWETPMQATSDNPPISLVPRLLTAFVALVLLIGASLFFLPDTVGRHWPWQLTPFNTRFLGAVYAAELVATTILVLVPRWAPGRLAIPAAVVFTTVVSLVSFLHLDRFDFARLRA